MGAKYQPGDRVRIRSGSPPGHFRTPTYVQGKTGVIAVVHGAFRNPETLAYGGNGLPEQYLYLVQLDQVHVWGAYVPPQDTLCLDIYEHWLEPA